VLLGSLLAAGACSSGGGSGSSAPPATTTVAPVRTARTATLPLPYLLRGPVALTSSGNRLVLTPAYGAPGGAAVFDATTWEWTRLPDLPGATVAVDSGLITVDMQCGPSDETSNRSCRTRMRTLRWGDHTWRRSIWLQDKAEVVHEAGPPEITISDGRWAYVQSATLHSTLRVDVDGHVERIPRLPWTIEAQRLVLEFQNGMCPASDRLDALAFRSASFSMGSPPLSDYGPVYSTRLGRDAAWNVAPDSATTPMGEGTEFSVGCAPGRGIVVLVPSTGVFEWTRRRWAPRTAADTPDRVRCCDVTANGDLVAVGGAQVVERGGGLRGLAGVGVYRLRNGRWERTPVADGENVDAAVAVGDLVVYATSNPATGEVLLRALT
jgi:hypothetical protein